jgi:eukaryotic-like serine/threonine-protein kinase
VTERGRPGTPSTGEWQAVLAHFEYWSDALPDEAATLLERLRSDEPRVHAQLAALIEAEARADAAGFMPDGAALSLPGRGHAAGERLGAWELREPIGEGGMGQVWLAQRSDGLYAGKAAVKLLHASRSGPLADARFAREGELLARLSHPRIARLLDAGRVPDGARWLVLEHVAGERIDAWCDARRLGVRERLALFVQLCEAVSFAHANLVVHRDLKPANVLVTADGQVKLLDFGVAKLLADEPAASDLTQAGPAGLTPEYASPEQLSGAPVTTATDVYALGVVLYALLAGRRPYGHDASTPLQMARAIVEADPARLDAPAGITAAVAAARGTTTARLRAALAGDLEHIVQRALRKQPAERYASVQALADDIGRHLRHEPVSAQAPTLAYRSAKFVRRHRAGVGAAAVLAVAVAAGVGATLWQAGVAREQLAVAKREAELADSMKDFLFEMLSSTRVERAASAPEAAVTLHQVLDSGARRLIANRTLPTEQRLELLDQLAVAHWSEGLLEGGDRLRQEAVRVAREAHGPRSEAYAHTLTGRGMTLPRLGKAQEGRALLTEAIAVIKQNQLERIDAYPVALYQLAMNMVQTDELGAATAHLTRSAAMFEKYHPQHRQRAIAVRWLGTTLTRQEQFEAAEAKLLESIAVSQRQEGLQAYGTALAQHALGEMHLRTGRFADAQAQLTKARDIGTDANGPRHLLTGMTLVQLARAQQQLGQRDEADALLRTAAEIARERPSLNIAGLNDMVLLTRAQVALGAGDVASAQVDAAAAAARWAPLANIAHASVLVLQAEIAMLGGEHDAAVALAQRASERLAQAPPLAALHARVALGDSLARRAATPADGDAARAAYQAALSGDSALPTQRWLHARAELGLARLSLPGDAAGALRLAQQAAARLPANEPVLQEQIALADARLVEARALRLLARPADARAALEQALAMTTATQVPASPRLAELRAELASLAR